VINNFSIKLMAVLFAVILWLVVVNIDDPTQTKTYTTSVTVENENAITKMGKYFAIEDGDNTVSFQVTAKRSIFRALSNTDFKAVADMSKIEDMKRVPIVLTATRYTSYVSFPADVQYLNVKVEELQTKQFAISAAYTGTPAENCAVGDVSVASSNVLKVSGPASVVSTITSAKATINVDGMSTNITDFVVPTLLDADGKAVDTTKLTLNMDTVSISAAILDIKYVPINAAISGKPQSGYENTSVLYSPQTVAIKGSADTLNTVNSIEIPQGIVNVDGANGDVTQTVDISSYLPDGVTLANVNDKKIAVTAKIEQMSTKTFSVPANNITITNVPAGYDVVMKNDTVSLSINGLESNLANLTASSIKGVVDASGLGEGDHTLTIDLELDKNLYKENGSQTAIVTVTKNDAGSNGATNSSNTKKTSGSTAGKTSGNTTTDTSGGNKKAQ
jgi:YbbR domain-containing protein